MTFTTIQELRDYIVGKYTANGAGLITGPDGKDALIGILDLIAPVLQQQLIANLGVGQSIGSVQTGDTFPIGTTLEEIVRKILIKAITPTYIQPSLSLDTTISQFINEVGVFVSPTLNATFVQNDGGAQSAVSLKKNGVQIATTLSYQDLLVQLNNTPVSYQSFVTYLQGACKNNNLGAQDCTGRVLAGTISSNTITYSGFRKLFWGTPVIVPVDSATVRSSLTNTSFNPQDGTQFTINIPQGAQRVVFAYPATLQDVTTVKYVQLSNSEVKNNFVKSLVNVEGANGFSSVQYKVYIYTPVEPFPAASTYIVTI